MEGVDNGSRMSQPTAPDADLDERMQRYAAIGYTRPRMLAQLLAAGYPTADLRARFPEMPDAAFGLAPPSPVAAPPRPQGRAAAPLTQTRSQGPAPVPTSVATRIAAQAQRETDPAGEGISFHYVPLIQCSFPHTDPGEVSAYTRKNGWLELTLGTTRPETGLPYGVPARLLTIYCASEAIRTRSPEIYLGQSVHEFLRRLDVPITRGPRGSLTVYTHQLLRLIHCTLSIDENIRDGAGRQGLHIRQALFAEEAQLWWDEDHAAGQGSSLMLSPVLFHSILERSAPLATSAIKALRKSPMDLDVYAWLVHRLYHLRQPSHISWPQLSDQFGHGYAELRKFRRFFIDSLKRVQTVYPQARLEVSPKGVLLKPSRPHLARPERSR